MAFLNSFVYNYLFYIQTIIELKSLKLELFFCRFHLRAHEFKYGFASIQMFYLIKKSTTLLLRLVNIISDSKIFLTMRAASDDGKLLYMQIVYRFSSLRARFDANCEISCACNSLHIFISCHIVTHECFFGFPATLDGIEPRHCDYPSLPASIEDQCVVSKTNISQNNNHL